MGSEPLYLDGFISKNDTYYQSIPVTHNIEHDPVIRYNAGIPIHAL